MRVKGPPQREEKGVKTESGYRGYTNQGPAEGGEGREYREWKQRLYISKDRRGRRRAAIQRTDIEAIHIKGPQK